MLYKPFSKPYIGMTGVLTNNISVLNIDFLLFFCVMIPMSVINDVGLLDESFNPGGFEDADYCMRLRDKDYEFTSVAYSSEMRDGNAIVNMPMYHKAEVTVNTIKDWDSIFQGNYKKLLKKWGVQ